MTGRFLKALLLTSLLLCTQPAGALSGQGCRVRISLADEDGVAFARQLQQRGLCVELDPQGRSARCELSADWASLQRAMGLLQDYARQHRLPLPSRQIAGNSADVAISSRPVGLDAASASHLLLCLNDEPLRAIACVRIAPELLPDSPPVLSAGPAARAVRGPPTL